MLNELNKPTVGGNHIPAKAEAIQSPPTNRKDLLFLNLFDMNKIQQKILGKFKGAWKTVANTAESFVDVPKAYFELLQAYKEVNKTEKALIDALIKHALTQKEEEIPLFEYEWDEQVSNKTAWIPPKTNDMVENVKLTEKEISITWKLKIIIWLWADEAENLYPTEKWYEFIKKNQQAINDCYDALYDFSTKAMNTKLTTYKAMNNAVMTYRVFLIATFFLGIGLGTYHLVSANDGTENTGLPTDSLDIEDTELIDADDTQQTENTETSISTSAYMLDEMSTGGDEPFDFDTNGNMLYEGDDTNVRALINEYNAEVPEFAKKDLMQLQQALVQQNLTDEELTNYMADAFTIQAHLYDLDKRFRIEDNKIIYGQGGPDNIAFTDYATNTKHPQAFRDFMTHYEDDNTPPTAGIIPDASDNETTTTETTTTPTEVADPLASFDYKAHGYTTEQWTDMPPEVKKAVAESAGFDVSQVGGDLKETIQNQENTITNQEQTIKANNDTIQNLKNKIKQK